MFRLTPTFKEKIWGSTQLEPLFPDSQTKIGEVWFEGVDNLPLLVKFLFTTDKLSVQVHPNDAYARQHHQCAGKTEMWHILRAEPGAKIAAGFRERITPERLREASLSGDIENLLQWHVVKPGDTFFIPAGTVHAIGAGLTICEIQQQSDITYRLYDYGRPRELHLDEAAKVSDLGPLAEQKISVSEATDQVLVACPHFTTSRLCISNTTSNIPASVSPRLVVVIEGSGTISEHCTKAGDVWYLEAGVRETVFSGYAILLLTQH